MAAEMHLKDECPLTKGLVIKVKRIKYDKVVMKDIMRTWVNYDKVLEVPLERWDSKML